MGSDTLESNFSILNPLVKTTIFVLSDTNVISDTDSNSDTDDTVVSYLDVITNKSTSYKSWNKTTEAMNGQSVHTISPSRNYIITSETNNQDLFTTGG